MEFYYELIHRERITPLIQKTFYKPSVHTQGAWNENEQHMAPATGLICSELEDFVENDNKQIARLSLDILGMIYLDEFSVTTKVVRSGKTIELIESVWESKGKTCIVCRIWRLMKERTTEVEGLEDTSIPHYSTLENWTGMNIWSGGYIKTVFPHIKAGERRPGKGIAWISNQIEMVKGKKTSAFVKLMGMVDTMNGLVVRQESPFQYAFPNVDLQIHLYRLPSSFYLGLNVQQQYGRDGVGLTSAVLHDEKGSFGHAEQILTIRKM